MPFNNSGFVREPSPTPQEHTVIRVERARYIYFTCPRQPMLELTSFDVPKQCPICRCWKPIELGTPPEGSYSAEFGDDIIPFCEVPQK